MKKNHLSVPRARPRANSTPNKSAKNRIMKNEKRKRRGSSISKKTKQTTISFEEKRRTNDRFTIKCRMNKKTCNVIVDPEIGCMVSKIQKAFHWSKTQQAGVLIIGLKNENKDKVFFKESAELAYEHIINTRKRIKRSLFLLPGHTYDLLIQDVRDKAVENLSENEILEIKQQFKKMDLNGDGVVEIKEIEEFHDIELRKKLKKWKFWIKSKVKQRKEMKKAYETVMSEGIERDKQIRNRNIRYYKELDVDSDGEISWEEFLNSEAVLRAQKRMKKEKKEGRKSSESNTPTKKGKAKLKVK